MIKYNKVGIYGKNRKTKEIVKQWIVDDHGEKTVIHQVKECQELLEDLHDLAVVTDWRKELAISYDKVKKA